MAPGEGTKAGDTGEDARVSRTRADVARAALEVLTTDGSDAVTHARVAEVAGYSKTTLYTHWPARVDLIAMAIESLGDMPHHERTGVLRDDLIGELHVFRAGVLEMRLDRVLSGMAEWASEEQMARIRQRVNTDGQHQMYEILGELFSGPALDAAVSMLTGVVACPAIMFGSVPDDAVIEAAVDVVLNGHSRTQT
ncbi:TetR/AcrR family transcriptional regulator [Mycobacterium sp. NPDC006124]|uniref:TetR/AcrR family transcriptional regulator n=1 Tax=Mycobacterium sp. NPDC006124 TaxID=3156729 RepID=UPI0033A3E45D